MELPPLNRIGLLREERKLSLRDLAQMAGMDVNKVHRLETGAIKLDLDSMRRLARAMGLRASALLLDEDVELRADEIGMKINAAIEDVAPKDRPDVVDMAIRLVEMMRETAAVKALKGGAENVRVLAETWNALPEEGQSRALSILRAASR